MLSRNIRYLAVFLLLFGGMLGIVGTPAWAQQKEPPFDWDPKFASPGTSLSVEVVQTMGQPPNGIVMVSIKATGFSQAGGEIAVWRKLGTEYSKLPATLGADGTVQIFGAGAMMLGGQWRGLAFDIAVIEEATGRRVHGKIIPFPITARGAGGCKGNAEIVTNTGRVWLITLSGFAPGETVSLSSTYKKETVRSEHVASEAGEIGFPILYPKRAKKKARVTAEGSLGCSLTLEFAVGKSAQKAK